MTQKTVYSNENGVRRTLIQEGDDPNGDFIIQTDVHVGSVIALAEEMRQQHTVIGHRKSQMMTPVAELPVSIIEPMMRDGSLFDQAALRKVVNDPDNRPFRITDGRF